MSNEQDHLGIVRASELIPVATSGPFVATTPNVTDAPDPRASEAFYATISKDLGRRNGGQGGAATP